MHFNRGHYEEHFYEIILNFDLMVQEDPSFKDIMAILVGRAKPLEHF